jgi:hypothetical protein
MRAMRAITLVLLWLLLTSLLPAQSLPGAAAQQPRRWYDHDTRSVSEEESIFQEGYGSFVLDCEASCVVPAGEASSFHLRGIAFPLAVDGRTFYLGAGHVFDLQEALSTRGFAQEGTRIGAPVYSLAFQGRRYALHRVDDGSRDVAVFVPTDGSAGLPGGCYPCGNSDELRLGSPVLSWGMPLMEDFELSTGIVSALTAPRSLVEAAFPGAAAGDFFVTSMPTIFGCSGAPVYAFRAGRPEIVGMLVAGYLTISRSVVFKINSILRDSVPR